jgi:hypothetical protein
MDSLFYEGNDEIEKISLDQLYDRKKEIDQLRLSVYNKILKRIHQRIKYTSRQKYNEQFLFYVVPEFMIGIPRYDVTHCTIYVMQKLQDNGFNVKYTHPNMLFISWNHYIPNYERDVIKKKYGVNINGFGVVKKEEDVTNNAYIKNTSTKSNAKDENYRDVSKYNPKSIYDKDLFVDLN